MRRVVMLLAIIATVSLSGQKKFSSIPLTDLITGKTLILGSDGDGTNVLNKLTGAQLLTYVLDSLDAQSVQSAVSPSYVISVGTDGKLAKTPTAVSGFAFGAFTAYATGTPYTLTASVARVDFTGTGAVDPQVDLTSAGTYMLFVQGSLLYSGSTFAANQTITIRLRRSNNTAANIANTDQVITVPIMTSYTGHAGRIDLPIVIYTTANANDQLQVFAGLSATPSDGSVQVTQCSVLAIRLY